MSIWSKSIVHKLINRQVHGTYQHKHNAQNNAGCFSEKIPDHCELYFSDIINNTNHLIDHMFMGLTRCGQFLMSYTEYKTGLEYEPFKFYFWTFGMGQKACLISEIVLFEKCHIENLLNIQIFQWSNRSDRVIIVGERINEVASDLFFTVTMLPNFKSFKNCGSLAHKDRHEDFDEEVSTNTCYDQVHTVHASFNMSNLFANPLMSFKYDDHIVFCRNSSESKFISIAYIDFDLKQVIELDRSEIINAPIINKLSIDLIKLGYEIPTKSDNPVEGIENKLINTNYYLLRDKLEPIYSMGPLKPYNLNKNIWKEQNDPKHIKEINLELKLISNNVAGIICNLEGLKFWELETYDHAIIDICSMNGDILIIFKISMTCVENENQKSNFMELLTTCMILWNNSTNYCILEGYKKPAEIISKESLKLVIDEVNRLREANLGFFKIQMGNQVRYLYDIWYSQESYLNIQNVPSIQDDENMVILRY